jgi:hypothetical protein
MPRSYRGVTAVQRAPTAPDHRDSRRNGDWFRSRPMQTPLISALSAAYHRGPRLAANRQLSHPEWSPFPQAPAAYPLGPRGLFLSAAGRPAPGSGIGRRRRGRLSGAGLSAPRSFRRRGRPPARRLLFEEHRCRDSTPASWRRFAPTTRKGAPEPGQTPGERRAIQSFESRLPEQ